MCIRIRLHPHWLLPAPLSVCRCMQASVYAGRLCAYMLCVCNVRGPNCSISADYSLVCRLLWYQSSCSQMMMRYEICRTGIGYNGGAYPLRSRTLVHHWTKQPREFSARTSIYIWNIYLQSHGKRHTQRMVQAGNLSYTNLIHLIVDTAEAIVI